MSDKQAINLSRRRVLGGIGAIGVASAGAALGTSAYFSDEESFDGNSLTAGELDLFVHYNYTADQGSASGNLSDPTSGVVQGDTNLESEDEVSIGYRLVDVKPGDSGTLRYCPAIVDNPAWLWVGSENGVIDFENGQSEPEASVDPSGGDPGEGAGELSEAIQVTVSYCDTNGETIREMNNPAGYTLADLSADLAGDGFLLDGTPDTEGASPFPGSSDAQEPSGPCICIDWEIPTDVGNEIQTDSVEFDLSFHAQQSRHNDSPASPFNVTNST